MADEEHFDLEGRLRVLLPETYEVFDDEVQPKSMGSAGLKYGPDGKVLWNEIWRSFCDLAMAGGPPHRGKLLKPSLINAAESDTEAYGQISQEICRGLSLVTGLYAEPGPALGWLQMYCPSAAMRGWLTRAIVMENVATSGEGLALYLPTGPHFRVEKEVKNVITAVAKTCHYWRDHMSDEKHDAIATLLATMDREAPLVRPALWPGHQSGKGSAAIVTREIENAIGLPVADHGYSDWLGFDCGEVGAAIWMMRALVVSNVLSRREGTVVFLPSSAAGSAAQAHSVRTLERVRRIAATHQVLA